MIRVPWVVLVLLFVGGFFFASAVWSYLIKKYK
jgi:hypothetical protein